MLVSVKTPISLSPLLDSHVGCAVYETPFAGTPTIGMLPVATAAGNGRDAKRFSSQNLGFSSPLPSSPAPLSFVSPSLHLEGRGV